ncbi:MAG TPA: polysaccharide deacetylase family protein [Bacteroidales bacterium]|nr:polysaccharide deacetylase family protein [Bacteroidales bacterium]
MAAVFWHVTRMEEYSHFAKNALTRFTSDMSIARKIGILQKPIVNIWTELVLNELKLLYPDLVFDKPAFKYIPSIDVESVYMYKAKGLLRTFGGIVRDVFKKDFAGIKKRFKVITGKEKDPWFCFDEINNLHKKYNYSAYYFFLLGKFSNLDRNISPSRQGVKNLIRELAKDYTIGIHNSYRGNSKPKVWSKELRILKKITKQDIFSSRQHYLFVRFPSTYEDLIKMGIKRDFSMVYPDMPGFRMGITVPIPFFDLKTNLKTDLWLYPTMIMDVGLTNYQNLSTEEAKELCGKIVNYTKQYGGILITLWHNESLSDYGKWEGWIKVYESILESAKED